MWLYKFILMFRIDGYIVQTDSGTGVVLEPFFSYMKRNMKTV